MSYEVSHVGSNHYHEKLPCGLEDSEEKPDANIFSVPDSETGQQSAPHIQLKLMPRQPQQETADRVLVENNFDTVSVTWRSKFSAVLLWFKCTIIILLDDSNLNAFHAF